MIFQPVGVVLSDTMTKFRDLWVMFTGQENGYLSKVIKDVSPMQHLIINMTTGVNEPYKDSEDLVIAGKLPMQMELEALFRARSRAMAAMFQNSVSQ